MKRFKNRMLSFLFLPLLLVGCNSTQSGNDSIIDWVDFVKFNGVEYYGINSGILSNENLIGDKLGEVKFRVADHITNPSYQIKDGDAAFHEKGTAIYSIKGYNDFLALKDKSTIHGFRVYYAKDKTDYKWNFKNVALDKVNLIEIYQSHESNIRKISDLKDKEKLDDFLNILKTSKEDVNFQPNIKNGAPIYYDLVLYTDEPIAYKFDIQFDGANYYWNPWDTAILSKEIKEFIPK
ncbi:hypothetical protein ACFCYN_24170 [Gottfriedia sp. NPDC056225]|uniref:hypothetical protein n=1 Tax=Gottfriedia sp. NPDC056225 TaxID=3345751 RepID=UPI001558C8B9|nr:hypothetical protein HPK19_08465 [Arthrobacter citreus]